MQSQPLTILIDGYNVSRNLPGSRLKDGVALATARENLLAQVRARFHGTPHRVTVVFDGSGEREVCTPLKGLSGSQCIFTQRGTTADAVIVRLAQAAAEAGCEMVVCTNDLEVRSNTRLAGARHTSVADLAQQFNAPDKHTAKRLRRTSLVRRQFEATGDEDEPSAVKHPRKGNPRRAPKRQRGRGERLW